jgi:hypothetical protein
MNLIEIQENLKDLPTQAIMAYANGQNPEVPPYMALGELNRRKSMEQRAAQPPTQSVKDQLEGEMGLPSVMPPPVTPQGMPPGMPPGRPPMPPQGMPQAARPPMQAAPQAAQPAPQPVPQPVPRMAAGGLTNIPMNRDIFKYAPGGIVAFADGELVRGGGGEFGEDTAGEAEARANMNTDQGPPITAKMPGAGNAPQSITDVAQAVLQNALSGASNLPNVQTKADIRDALVKKAQDEGKPELAKALSEMPGSALQTLVTQLQAQNEASKNQFQQGEGKMGLAALSNALIAAGEATRGQKGMGLGEAFGGFGKSYNAATADEVKRQQAQQALERQQMIETAKLQSDVDNLRSAYASGNVSDIQDAQKIAQDQAYKVQNLKTGAAEKVLAQATQATQVAGTLAHYKALEQNEALRLQEMIQNNANANAIAQQRLRVEQANVQSEIAHRRAQDDLAAATKTTASEKLDQQTQSRINADPAIRELAKKLGTLDLGSDDYYDTLSRIREIAITHYPKGADIPPPVKRTPPIQPPAKPSFISSLFGGSKPAAAPASNAVRFEDLPK